MIQPELLATFVIFKKGKNEVKALTDCASHTRSFVLPDQNIDDIDYEYSQNIFECVAERVDPFDQFLKPGKSTLEVVVEDVEVLSENFFLIDASTSVDSLRSSFLIENDSVQKVIQDTLINSILKSTYQLRNRGEIINFLISNLNLVKFLLESLNHLEKQFETNAKYILELFKDPELHNNTEQLFVVIRTSLSSSEALKRLDIIDNEWFLDQLDKVGNLVNFNLEII